MGKWDSGGVLISRTPAEFYGLRPVRELWNHRWEPFGVLDGVKVLDVGSCLFSDWAVVQLWNTVVSSRGLTREKSRTAGKVNWLQIDLGHSRTIGCS